MYTNEAICALIRSEIVNNNQYYRRFYCGEIEEMLATLDKYLTKGVYAQQIVDIVVLAAAKCLSVNLCIYKKLGKVAQLYMQPSNPLSTRDVYLLYNNEHYDAIVCKHTPSSSTMNNSTPKTSDQKAQFNPNITLLNQTEQEYLNSLGIEIKEKDLGPKVCIDEMNTPIKSNKTSNLDTKIIDDNSNFTNATNETIQSDSL